MYIVQYAEIARSKNSTNDRDVIDASSALEGLFVFGFFTAWSINHISYKFIGILIRC